MDRAISMIFARVQGANKVYEIDPRPLASFWGTLAQYSDPYCVQRGSEI